MTIGLDECAWAEDHTQQILFTTQILLGGIRPEERTCRCRVFGVNEKMAKVDRLPEISDVHKANGLVA